MSRPLYAYLKGTKVSLRDDSHNVCWLPNLHTLKIIFKSVFAILSSKCNSMKGTYVNMKWRLKKKLSKSFWGKTLLGNFCTYWKNCDISPCGFLAMTAQFPLSSPMVLANSRWKVSALTLTALTRPSSWIGTPSLYQVSSGSPEHTELIH